MSTIITTMIQKSSAILKNSYSPYSHFSVASCICTEDDTLFLGVNIENAAYGLTCCAEASAISHMVTSGYTRIKSIVILAGNNLICTPCGACRQRIFEFSIPETLIYLCNKNKVLEKYTIHELLPSSFSFKPNEE